MGGGYDVTHKQPSPTTLRLGDLETPIARRWQGGPWTLGATLGAVRQKARRKTEEALR